MTLLKVLESQYGKIDTGFLIFSLPVWGVSFFPEELPYLLLYSLHQYHTLAPNLAMYVWALERTQSAGWMMVDSALVTVYTCLSSYVTHRQSVVSPQLINSLLSINAAEVHVQSDYGKK